MIFTLFELDFWIIISSPRPSIAKPKTSKPQITFETLDKFNIPYDEIYFGKPYADFYIDDLALNCFDDLEKEMGYYNNKIEPRDFHTINVGSFDTIIKNGDLKGENYYYLIYKNNTKPYLVAYDTI